MRFHCSPEVIIIPTQFFCVFYRSNQFENFNEVLKWSSHLWSLGCLWCYLTCWVCEELWVSSGLYGLLMFGLRVCYKECWCTKALKWCVYFSSRYCHNNITIFIVKSGLVDSALVFFGLFIYCCRIGQDCQSCGWCILQHSSCKSPAFQWHSLPSIPKRGLAVNDAFCQVCTP